MNDNFRNGMCALVVVALTAWFIGWAGDHGAQREDDLPPDVAAAIEELRDGKVGIDPAEPAEPPKELRPGMAWEVTGAGDAGYNGVYEEDGTYNGQPAYTNGSKWLYWNSFGFWALESSKTEPPSASQAYGGTGESLPATPWSVLAGIAPAPTVAEYVEPPTPPDPNDTTTKRTGWIGGPLSPTLFPCAVVKPARFVGTDSKEYVAFLGIHTDPTLTTEQGRFTSRSVVLYCINNGTWLNLTGATISPTYTYVAQAWGPHPCLLPAGDGNTLWFVTAEMGVPFETYMVRYCALSAWPLTLDIANQTYTVGSKFEPGVNRITDLAIDAANTAWFMTEEHKLYSWALSGASATLVHDWATGRDEHGLAVGARFWYSGVAGTFYRTHNPTIGIAPDYIHRVSASVYEWTGDTMPGIGFSYDHDIARNLTYAVGTYFGNGRYVSTYYGNWRYREGSGDGWKAPNFISALGHVWVIRGTPMALAGVNNTQ